MHYIYTLHLSLVGAHACWDKHARLGECAAEVTRGHVHAQVSVAFSKVGWEPKEEDGTSCPAPPHACMGLYTGGTRASWLLPDRVVEMLGVELTQQLRLRQLTTDAHRCRSSPLRPPLLARHPKVLGGVWCQA